MNGGIFLIGAAILAVIVGVVLFVTFMSNKKHEGKHQGFLKKVYNFEFLIAFTRRTSFAFYM